jgi:cell division protein ZapA
MSAASVQVSVTIMGRQYRIACPPDERDSLQRAAYHVNSKMQEISASGTVLGMDKLALFAALNIAHELFEKEAEKSVLARQLGEQIRSLREMIDNALPASELRD